MTEKMIIDAYCRIRTIDNTIPDDVLDFIKDAAIEKLRKHGVMCDFHCERFEFGRDEKCNQQCSDCHWMQTKLHQPDVVEQSEQLVCDCGNRMSNKELYFGQCLQCDKNIEEAN